MEIDMTHPADGQARIMEAAASWHARLDAPDMDWAAFGAWLDTDPAHRDAYAAIALLDAEISDHRDAIAARLPANDPGEAHERPSPRHRRRWLAGGGMALAAGLVAVLAPQLPFFASEALVAYSTGPGETRTVQLEDGSHIVLDRNSRATVRDGSKPRVEVAMGNAYFDVRHDPARAFSVSAGDYEIRDIGTRFEVANNAGHLAVAVAEGQVRVAPANGGGGSVLTAGRRIDIDTGSGEAILQHVSTSGIGAWQNGRLVYDNTPLALVAADLSRYAGKAVTVDPSTADLRLSGVLIIGDGSRLVGQIEALLPVKALAEGDHIRLVRGSAR